MTSRRRDQQRSDAAGADIMNVADDGHGRRRVAPAIPPRAGRREACDGWYNWSRLGSTSGQEQAACKREGLSEHNSRR
jgi:hypothetical protein